jgi:hypothetical protein
MGSVEPKGALRSTWQSRRGHPAAAPSPAGSRGSARIGRRCGGLVAPYVALPLPLMVVLLSEQLPGVRIVGYEALRPVIRARWQASPVTTDIA